MAKLKKLLFFIPSKRSQRSSHEKKINIVFFKLYFMLFKKKKNKVYKILVFINYKIYSIKIELIPN